MELPPLKPQDRTLSVVKTGFWAVKINSGNTHWLWEVRHLLQQMKSLRQIQHTELGSSNGLYFVENNQRIFYNALLFRE